MKIENLQRAIEIVDQIKSKKQTVELLQESSFVAITTLSGFGHIQIPLNTEVVVNQKYNGLAIRFRDDVVDQINSEISDLEDELETL